MLLLVLTKLIVKRVVDFEEMSGKTIYDPENQIHSSKEPYVPTGFILNLENLENLENRPFLQKVRENQE